MTVNIDASTNSKRIPIGRCEDNEATRVVFDCSGFSSAYGSGQATLLHRRSKEKISYIVQNVTQEDDAVTWTVSSDDTAFSGEGTLQLMWTVNDVVAHSVFYTTITDQSLTDSSSEPTEVKSALQLLIDSCYTKEETDNLIAHMRVGSLTLGMNTNDEITITPAQLAKLLGLVKENHWESHALIPDGYVKYGTSQVYTEYEASISGDTYCAVYYLPEEIDLDAMSRLEVVTHCCYPASVSSGESASLCSMYHETSNSLSDTFAVNWSNNCQGITLGRLAVVKASSFTSGQDAYEFPSNVKTIAVYNPLYTPNQYTGHQSNYFVSFLSLDWTLK